MADKIVYMRAGETLEIRHVEHADLGRNAKDWQWQPQPKSDLFKIDGPGSITPSRPDFVCNDCREWTSGPQRPATVATSGSGWAMLPLDPTPKMQIAGYDALGADRECRCDQYDCYRAMVAMAPQFPAPEIRVLPLKWERNEAGSWFAHSILGVYLVRDGRWWIEGRLSPSDAGADHLAKTAAQTHYETAILSATASTAKEPSDD